MLRAGEAPPGELLDLAEPVAERLLVHVHIGGSALPRSVGSDERSDGVDVVRPVRVVVCEQRAEYLFDKRLRLRRAARHQQAGAVAVRDHRDGVGLGDAQCPHRFLRRIADPVGRPDQVAHADHGAGPADGVRRQTGRGALGHDRVQKVIAAEQQVRDARP
jgi:hypothetical protein